jgi:phage tail-like protein
MDRALIPRLLPENYRVALRGDSPLDAVLAVMDAMHAPAERALDRLDAHLDPLRAPEGFVLMLAGWLGLERYLDWSGGRWGAGQLRFPGGLERLRRLVSAAARLEGARGTRDALLRFLVISTGVEGFAIDENCPDAEGVPRPFHIRVTVPAAAARLSDLIARIVEGEGPAHVTFEILAAPAAKEG